MNKQGGDHGGDIDPLVALGFTHLEAEIYGLLLDEPGSTGYRLAQRLRKPAPNVYKAIESLESKGAVMVVDGKHRHCSAVPPEELLSHLERRFQASKRQAAQALAERSRPPADDRVYQLKSANAVFQKARSMLERAKDVLILDAFPKAARELLTDVESAAERGVEVGALLYEPLPGREAQPGFEIVVDPRGGSTMDRWPGQWLLLVVDASEMLMAFLSPDLTRVHQAIWSRSPYLVWVQHGGSASELLLAAVESALADSDLGEAKRILKRLGSLKAYGSTAYRHLRDTLEPVVEAELSGEGEPSQAHDIETHDIETTGTT